MTRFEDKGLNVVAMKLMRVTPELARRHYAEHVEKGWYPKLETFITGGPLVAMIIEGPEAICVVRQMVGVTNGLKAKPGTIRGDFSSSRQMNLVHASDSPEASLREIAIFFRPKRSPYERDDPDPGSEPPKKTRPARSSGTRRRGDWGLVAEPILRFC